MDKKNGISEENQPSHEASPSKAETAAHDVSEQRRRALQKILAGSAITGSAAATSQLWVKPVINAAIVPVHAQTSADTDGTDDSTSPPTTPAPVTTPAPPPPPQREEFSLNACSVCGQGSPFVVQAGANVQGSVTPAAAGVELVINFTIRRTGTVMNNTGVTILMLPQETILSTVVTATTDEFGNFNVAAAAGAAIEQALAQSFSVTVNGNQINFVPVGTFNPGSGTPVVFFVAEGNSGYSVSFSGTHLLEAAIAFSDTPNIIEETCTDTALSDAPCAA